MKQINRRLILAGVAGAVPFYFGGRSNAQEKITLRFGWTTGDGAQDPYAIGARAFKEEVEKRSNGRIAVQFFPNGSLGDEQAMIDGMRAGTLDAGIITNAVIARAEPAFQINDMPFLFKDEAQAQKVLDGTLGKGLAQRLESKGVVALGYMEGGFRQMINNKKPVHTPADVQGVKYRVLQSPIYINLFKALGGTGVPIAWGDTFLAVQQGSVDGLEIPVAVIDQNKFFQITKFMSLTNHIYSMIGLVMSKATFDRLSPEMRKIVTEASAAATTAQRRQATANARTLVETLKTKGMQVNTVDDPAPFRRAVMPMYESFKGQIGADVIQEALAAVQ